MEMTPTATRHRNTRYLHRQPQRVSAAGEWRRSNFMQPEAVVPLVQNAVLASQAGEVGSIPIARSTFPEQNVNSCFWRDKAVTNLVFWDVR